MGCWLGVCGYKLLAKRWRSPLGEVDIIAVRRRCLVFAEVKYRTSSSSLAYAIDDRKIQRYARAANHFLGKYPQYAGFDCAMRAYFVSWRGIKGVEMLLY